MNDSADRHGNGAKLPDETIAALELYRTKGLPPGEFLQAILSNDLKRAVSEGLSDERETIAQVVAWAHGNLPTQAWGSEGAVEEWIDRYKRTSRRARLNALVAKLRELAAGPGRDYESDHARADDLLIEYIGDGDVAGAFGAVGKWYS